jgi:uncharacterized protein (TIGR02145 family)
MAACPPGWRLPDSADWNDLARTTGAQREKYKEGVYIWTNAGTKLKSRQPHWNGTDDFGFSALPGGTRIIGGEFSLVGDQSIWWSATEHDTGRAWYRGVDLALWHMGEPSGRKGSGMSVRCVQN